MSTLYTALNTSVSGLNAAQSSIDLTSRNVANVNTQGYTKKVAQFSPLPYGGVSAPTITRQVNQTLLQQSREEGNKLAGHTAASRFLSSMAAFLGTPATGAGTDGGRLNIHMQDLSAKIQNLATTPNLSTSAVLLRDSANQLAGEINDTAAYIQTLRQQTDYEIGQSIDEANRILDKIYQLNQDISRSYAMGQDAAALDLQDRRDMEIAKLSEYFAVKTYPGATKGSLVVLMENGPVLVDAEVRRFAPYNSAGTVTDGMSWGDPLHGFSKIAFEDSPDIDITHKINNGALGALVGMRDGVLPQYQAQLDVLASTLRDSLNEIHNQGASFPSSPQPPLIGSKAYGPAANIDAANGVQITVDGKVNMHLISADGSTVDLGDVNSPAVTNIRQLADAINTKLAAQVPPGSATLDGDGRLTIIPPPNTNVAFVETNAAGERTPAVVTNSSNGDAPINGVSNFFGLSDFFVSPSLGGRTFESTTVNSPNQVIANASFTFKDPNGIDQTPPAPLNFTFTGTGTVFELEAQLNAALEAQNSTVTASVYRNGDSWGVRFQGSSTLNVVSNTGPLRTERYDLGASTTLRLNDNLARDPSLISRGKLQESLTTPGAFTLHVGDGTIAQQMGGVFNQSFNFTSLVGMGGQMTLNTYTAQFIGDIANRSAISQQAAQDQAAISMAVDEKLASNAAVNLDEELSNLIILQNAYGASARMISTIDQMLDTLFDAVR